MSFRNRFRFSFRTFRDLPECRIFAMFARRGKEEEKRTGKEEEKRTKENRNWESEETRIG